MAVKKASATKKKAPAKKRALKAVTKSVPKKEADSSPAICRSCHALPVGSVELVSLLLVLVFSLTAVLLTSVYALEVQADQLSALQARIR